jgi:uncharacterized RDD family membrane protein YckC
VTHAADPSLSAVQTPPATAGAPLGGYALPPAHRTGPVPPGYALPPGYAPPFVRPVPTAPGGAPLAGPLDRFLARLIDIAIMILPGIVAEFVAFIPFVLVLATSNGEPSPVAFTVAGIAALVIFFALFAVTYYVYEVTMVHRTGQTIGKRAIKIKIVRAQDGGPIDKRIATRRWLVGHVAPMIAPYFSYADVLWMLWDKPYQQCLHDKCAETLVVKVAA